MGNIKKLPDEVIAIIAAGEVAERPAQIIKELIENALDAHATRIEIRLINAGLDLIVITDNGVGMNKEDLSQCWFKHTTSKIITKEDLARVVSHGFRGEALASIAGVSWLEIQSRKAGSSRGHKVVIDNGQFISLQPIGTPEGTTITISQLFNKVPARRKFLKSAPTELKNIIAVVTEFALINYGVSFSVFNNEKNVLETGLKNGTLEDRISYLLGNQVQAKLLPVTYTSQKLQLSGFISVPQLSRKNTSKQYLFVNKRPVSDDKISSLIKKIYGSLLEPHAHPIFILSLQLDPEEIDVNIHPHKRKIEFLDSQDLYFGIRQALEEVLSAQDLTYQFIAPKENDLVLRDRQTINHTKNILKEQTVPFSLKEKEEQSEIIQIDKTYLAYPIKNGVALVDQHAAHERILFEEFKQAYLNNDKSPTRIKKKVLLDLGKVDTEVIQQIQETLEKLGFLFESKEQLFYLTHVPELLLEHDYLQLLTEIIDEADYGISYTQIDVQTTRVLNFLACRNAIMAGEYLSPEERKKLIQKLDEMSGIYTCPHGRPIRITLSVAALEKLFLRKK